MILRYSTTYFVYLNSRIFWWRMTVFSTECEGRLALLELSPIRCTHLIDKEML